ncbi:MAG: serine hydrolase domain-containing protein [Aggregatilineales bacterium]
MTDWQALAALLQDGIGKLYTAASAQVQQHGSLIYKGAFGTLDLEGRLNQGEPATPETFFDLASLTKLFTVTAFFRLIDAGRVTLDTPVVTVLPEFAGQRPIRSYPHPLNTGEWVAVVPPTDTLIDAGMVTFRHLLTHSSGLPAWLNLRNEADNIARLQLCFTTPFAYPPGTQAIYSDIGLILLGEAIARLNGTSLAETVQTLVLSPLNSKAHYRPAPADPNASQAHIAPTEWCTWRQRRIVGEVHDENAASFGGVAGHAGLFGRAADVAALAQVYLDGGGELISPGLVREAIRLQIGDRGLGWMLRSPETSSSGRFFSPNSYGHTGFTGTSVWVDPERSLVCVLLTNRVFYGRDADGIIAFRRAFHNTVIETLE